MKVYQINVVCGNGSTGRIAVDLLRTIQNMGEGCRIAYGRGKAPEGIDTIKISNRLDLYLHVLMTRLTDKHGMFSQKATSRLIKDIQRYKPDIIHLHNIHGYYVNYERLFRFLSEYNKPIVWTMHDCWAFTGHCAHYEACGCTQWKKKCEVCKQISLYPSSMNATRVKENYEKKKESFLKVKNLIIVTPSVWLKSQVQQSFFRDVKCMVIPNGIDLQSFLPVQTENDLVCERLRCNGKRVILGVANIWTKSKGYDDFLRLRELLDEKYIICMIGLNRKQVKKLPKGIVGVRRTESISELVKYYSVADVFLNLTYGDTFPTTNIEALACGTPVITYQTGGSPEILDESCGSVVNKGDLHAIVKEIERIVLNVDNIEMACKNRAKKFEKKACYEKYIELYHKIENGKE